VEEIVKSLGARFSVLVQAAGAGWKLQLPGRGEFLCDVAVGPRALEWYATLQDRTERREVWSDWMDYRGYDKTPEEELLAAKARDLAWFLEAWVSAADVRVTDTRRFLGLLRSTKPEWSHDGAWQPIQLHAPVR